MRRSVVATLAASVVCLVVVASVWARPSVSPIGPDQAFNGAVNGSIANAVIRVVCPGPEGRMGHPEGGQPVKVVLAVSTTAGFTGQAHRIEADILFATPPVAVPPRLAVFRYYDSPVAIPTRLLFPCSGSGRVVFRPISGGKTARPAVVGVSFVNIAAIGELARSRPGRRRSRRP